MRRGWSALELLHWLMAELLEELLKWHEYHLDSLVVSYEIILSNYIQKRGKEAAVGEGNSAVQNI